jgi:biopolymer transport protein ExbB/TolQ
MSPSKSPGTPSPLPLSPNGRGDCGGRRRFGPTLAAFAIGLPLAAAILTLVLLQPEGSLVRRYVSHPVELVEVVLFSCAIGGLLAKLANLAVERAALRRQPLPAWNGKTVPVADASRLLADLGRQPRWLRSTFLGKRLSAVLEFLSSRGSATELDDQLRSLADTDSISLEASYSLTRFITWAMPILGFLGTVLGITKAIANVSPDQLEKSLSTVTDGLALAFDATALALGLTMFVMFVTFLVERLEQSMLLAVDQFTEHELAHRFERTGAMGGELVELLRRQGQTLVQTTEQLVEKQAAVWAGALAEANRGRASLEADFRKQLAGALESALDKGLEVHAKRLAELEKQAAGPMALLADKLAGLAKLADGLAAQTQALLRLQEGEKQLVRLQQDLQQNLATLADAGAFQQAVHSLTAAIHLLTAHSATGPLAQLAQLGPARRPGAAA